mmetsp:Transcript_102377/g.244106  ORF Transcript_102377/g.244106 Transcript_102377/m.244106 type:complete len:201 (-) Transcript_102377:291-893(-)
MKRARSRVSAVSEVRSTSERLGQLITKEIEASPRKSGASSRGRLKYVNGTALPLTFASMQCRRLLNPAWIVMWFFLAATSKPSSIFSQPARSAKSSTALSAAPPEVNRIFTRSRKWLLVFSFARRPKTSESQAKAGSELRNSNSCAPVFSEPLPLWTLRSFRLGISGSPRSVKSFWWSWMACRLTEKSGSPRRKSSSMRR